jgi:hypothetical protein
MMINDYWCFLMLIHGDEMLFEHIRGFQMNAYEWLLMLMGITFG